MSWVQENVDVGGAGEA